MLLQSQEKSQISPQFLQILNKPFYFRCMKKLILFTLLLVISWGSYATKKNKHKKKVTTNKVVTLPHRVLDKTNSMRLCNTPEPQPAWFLEVPTNFTFPAKFQQPAAYRVVSTIDTVFNNFLHSIPYDQSNFKIMLPLFINNTIECKEFNITRTVTMDSVLQAKYPSLMSFKAFAFDNSLNAARIDCDGSSTKMMVTYDKKVYFITSIISNKTNYYVCYAKDDANFVKDKFEK